MFVVVVVVVVAVAVVVSFFRFVLFVVGAGRFCLFCLFVCLFGGSCCFKQSLYTFMKIIMDNQNHCMSIKQARVLVNAHKHNLLINSFCNNGYVCLY